MKKIKENKRKKTSSEKIEKISLSWQVVKNLSDEASPYLLDLREKEEESFLFANKLTKPIVFKKNKSFFRKREKKEFKIDFAKKEKIKLKKPDLSPYLKLSLKRHKALLSFILFSFIFVLPIKALTSYQSTEGSLEKIDQLKSSLDLNLKENVSNFVKAAYPLFKIGLTNLLTYSEAWKKIAGHDKEKRYLIIFQNNYEIRPTGGFMGSFALLDIADGKIKNIEIPGGGPYDLRSGLSEYLTAPAPLRLIKSRWEMQDANWFADFPASAKKIIWFYEKSGGATVDGVITFTASLLPELLEITGPLSLPEYNKILNKENVIVELQKAVEIEYNKRENKPKKIIADLFPKLLEKLLKEKNNLFSSLPVFNKALAEKNILIYFNDPELQKLMEELGWSGKIKQTPAHSDYLLVVNTNIAGHKTDGAIKETIDHQTEIQEDGSIVNTVSITREHQGKKGDLFNGARNVDYLKIYVPEKSILLEAQGFNPPPYQLFKFPEDYYIQDKDLEKIEGQTLIHGLSGTRISNEFDKTSFGNWAQVDPGEKITVSFKYKLPFKITDEDEKTLSQWIKSQIYDQNLSTYFLFFQKQPGSFGSQLKSQIKIPDQEIVWQSEQWQNKGKTKKINTILDKDLAFGLIFKK